MDRSGETTDEFVARMGPSWYYHGGLPGDPEWVSDAARLYGQQFGIPAMDLDDRAAEHGWEVHDPGYDNKIESLAQHWEETDGQS